MAIVASMAPAAEAALAGTDDPAIVWLEVRDASGMFDQHHPDQIRIASNLNGWDPSARPADGVLETAEGATSGWVFALNRDGAADAIFKFTRGSWATAEVAADGSDIQDRSLVAFKDDNGELPPVIRLTVEGFADQRGTRWPDLPPPMRPGEATVTGELRTFDHPSDILGNTRTVRVWLPPGYTDPENADRRYPVLYMNDGQNCFDAATASFGVEWGCDETATRLIDTGEIPPMLIVGIDNAGPARSAEYNPPSANFSHHSRVPTDTKPIGDRYLDMLTREIMPRIQRDYRVATGPEHTYMGGSSFGGNITLYAAMRHAGTFGRILVESPAYVAVGERFAEQLRAFDGPWPQRIFVAMGTREFDNPMFNRELIESVKTLRSIVNARGLNERNGRLRVVVEEDARHSEADWARRLPDAFRFLFAEAEPHPSESQR